MKNTENKPAELAAPTGSAETFRLTNEAKIRACNFFHRMQTHMGCCDECCGYLYEGDGDLCSDGKAIIAREMAYVDMTPDFPPNEKVSHAGPTSKP